MSWRRQPTDAGPCFIYAVQREDGAVKIGRTLAPFRRFQELSVSLDLEYNGRTCRMLAFWRGQGRDEKLLHQRFAAEALGGEWFRPTDRVLRAVGVPVADVVDDPLTPRRLATNAARAVAVGLGDAGARVQRLANRLDPYGRTRFPDWPNPHPSEHLYPDPRPAGMGAPDAAAAPATPPTSTTREAPDGPQRRQRGVDRPLVWGGEVEI
jgi:hypothetical protein